MSGSSSANADPQTDLKFAQANYQKNPTDKNLAIQLAKAYLRVSKPGEASKTLEAAAEAAPQDASIHYLLGDSLLRDQKMPEAAFELKRAFNLDSTKGIYAVRAGEALLGAQRFDELNEWCAQALTKPVDETSRITLSTLSKAAQLRQTGRQKVILNPNWSEGVKTGGDSK